MYPRHVNAVISPTSNLRLFGRQTPIQASLFLQIAVRPHGLSFASDRDNTPYSRISHQTRDTALKQGNLPSRGGLSLDVLEGRVDSWCQAGTQWWSRPGVPIIIVAWPALAASLRFGEVFFWSCHLHHRSRRRHSHTTIIFAARAAFPKQDLQFSQEQKELSL